MFLFKKKHDLEIIKYSKNLVIGNFYFTMYAHCAYKKI